MPNPFEFQAEDQTNLPKPPLETAEDVYDEFHNRHIEHREGEDDWMMESVGKGDPSAELKKERLNKTGWTLFSEEGNFWVYEKKERVEKRVEKIEDDEESEYDVAI